MHTLPPSTQAPSTFANSLAPLRKVLFYALESEPEQLPSARYQVLLAGKNFFHIKEISTGRVRGFRRDHNEACALAKTLETRI
jgi:hypothetical protein